MTVGKSIAFLVVAMLFGPCSGMAHTTKTAEVTIRGNSIVVAPAAFENFKEMYVRIIGPSRDIVLESHSFGEPIIWTPAPDSAEGKYKYKVLVVWYGSFEDSKRWLRGGFEATVGSLKLNTAITDSDSE